MSSLLQFHIPGYTTEHPNHTNSENDANEPRPTLTRNDTLTYPIPSRSITDPRGEILSVYWDIHTACETPNINLLKRLLARFKSIRCLLAEARHILDPNRVFSVVPSTSSNTVATTESMEVHLQQECAKIKQDVLLWCVFDFQQAVLHNQVTLIQEYLDGGERIVQEMEHFVNHLIVTPQID